MGNIQDLLAQILSARYGRDVRQSIHDAIRQCYDDGHAGAIDLQARTLLGDTDISGISETVTGAVVELDGAVGTAQTTADGAVTAAGAAQGTANETLTKLRTIGLIDSTEDTSTRAIANGNYTKMDSLTLPPGIYELVASIRIDSSYTEAIIAAINDKVPTIGDVGYQATTSTNRASGIQVVKHFEINEETTINSYVMVYGSGFNCTRSKLSAFGIKEV